MDETADLIAEEYDILLAESEVAMSSRTEADRKNVKSEAAVFSDRRETGGESQMSTPAKPLDLFPGPLLPGPGETEPDDNNLPPAPLPSSSASNPPKEPEPKLPDPDPDPEKGPPGVSPVPTREPIEPGPDVVDPGLEPLPA